MNILIIGAGKVGTSLAKDMALKGHKVSVIEKLESVCNNLENLKNIEITCGDGCDPYGAGGCRRKVCKCYCCSHG